jgi:hypothetical protein
MSSNKKNKLHHTNNKIISIFVFSEENFKFQSLLFFSLSWRVYLKFLFSQKLEINVTLVEKKKNELNPLSNAA